ncbi:MAG: MFS transporter [Candidatus Krumholzibacteriota bacterium]|nr:MFS transporter [Candidatus Krumholzibacteriota bacterium]
MTTNERLFNRNFFLLWQGQLVSQLGTQAFTIATMFWVKHATGSATMMGTIMMAAMIPLVLLSPIGGTIADRVSRKRIIVTCDVVNGVASLSLGVLMLVVPDATGLILAWLIAVAVTGGIAQSFFMPAISAAIPNLVSPDKVASANSLSEGSVQVATLVGQGLGGLLFRILGAPVLFIVDGITFLFSATSESFIKIPQELPEKAETWREAVAKFKVELREGLVYVGRHRGMRSLMLTSAIMNFFAMPFFILLPFYVEDTLGAGPEWFGFLLAAFGGGGIVGYVIAGSVPVGEKARAAMMIAALFLLSVSLVGVGVARSPGAAMALLAGAGVFQGIYNIHVMTILQKTTPDAYRGRVFGLLHTLVMGLSPISLGLTGIVADLLDQNAPLMFMICGGVLVATTLVAAMSRDYRNYLASKIEAEPAS